MRRFIQAMSVLVALSSGAVFASGFDYQKEDMEGMSPQNSMPVVQNEDYPYARDGKSCYLYTGYMYVYRFWTNSTRTFTTGSSALNYSPDNVFQSGFNAFEIVFGKELNRYLDAQFGYLQYLQNSKNVTINSTAVTASTRTIGAMGAIAFTFDPDYAFQVSMKLGAVVADNNLQASSGSTTYYAAGNQTNVEPLGGMDFLWKFTPNFGLRFGAMYIADVQNSISHGDLLGFLALDRSF